VIINKKIFVLIVLCVHLAICQAYAKENPVGVASALKEQILADASALTQTLLSVKNGKDKRLVVEHWSMGWEKEKGVAHYWRAFPVMQGGVDNFVGFFRPSSQRPAEEIRGVLVYICGITTENLENMALKYAEAGFLFLGLSWAELHSHYKLFSG